MFTWSILEVIPRGWGVGTYDFQFVFDNSSNLFGKDATNGFTLFTIYDNVLQPCLYFAMLVQSFKKYISQARIILSVLLAVILISK